MKEVYEIQTLPDAPSIRFLYIDGMHDTSSWQQPIDFEYCKINFFLRGHSYISINGRSHMANAGDILIYRPHDVHYGTVPFAQRIEYYEFLFEPAALSRFAGGPELLQLFAEHDPSGESVVLMQPEAARWRQLTDQLSELVACLRSNSAHRNLRALSLCLGIFLSTDACRDANQPLNSEGIYPRPLVSALDYIHRNLQEPLTNRDICAAACISSSYLHRLFQEHLHCTPHDYIRSRRLAIAKTALGGGVSVTEACFAAGFPDSSAFAAIFRSQYGITPTQYRKKMQKPTK